MSTTLDDERYYLAFEDRLPPQTRPWPDGLMFVWQVLAVMALGLGAWYLHWRWTSSIQGAALWFALPLVVAETFAYIGSLLSTYNMWRVKDTPLAPPPAQYAEIVDEPDAPTRPLAVDVFFPTYSEDPELVRLGLQDAKKLDYPYPIELNIWVLDDGKRPDMKRVTEEEGCGYFTRDTNVGFKAGNMHAAFERTSADIIVICDADTRPLPHMLTRTLGYFRDPKVAWIQTPQWFYDIPEGETLAEVLGQRLGGAGRAIGGGLERLFGPMRFGHDPFGNDPDMFFDVIQRRRNPANASFCCGAGSIHRREAVMNAALKEYADEIHHFVEGHTSVVDAPELRESLDSVIRTEAARDIPLQPYKYHVSEDIFTSLVLHADKEAGWKSVYHPEPLSRMLSPQDLLSFTVQRFKYAGGTLDIARTHNPLFIKGLSWPQRLMYFSTVYSYFAWLWIVVFLMAPIVYFATGIAPVASYGLDFYAHAIPFLIVNRLAFMVGTWGVDTARGEEYYICSFHLQIRAFWTILRGRKISFPVTPKVRQAGNFLGLVRPHLIVIGLTILTAVIHAIGLALGFFHDTGAFLVNSFWAFYNVITLMTIVRAALWKPVAPSQPTPAHAAARV